MRALDGFPDPDASNADRAALVLAEAEAHLARTREAERKEYATLCDVAEKTGRRSLREITALGLEHDEYLAVLARNLRRTDPILAEGVEILRKCNPDRLSQVLLRIERLRRYRQRAERRRSRAIAGWLTMERTSNEK